MDTIPLFRSSPALELEVSPDAKRQVRVIRRRYHTIKRWLDLLGCVVLLPIALPLMVMCGALVWLEDGGPVLFCQQRTGKGGRRFAMWKFRTMVKNAEELKLKFAHLNELTWPDFKIANDPRMTFVGKYLRKTSLDELPQLFNVVLGEMSFVGPRPTSFASDTYELRHTERLEVVPGITGLWQVSGRSNVDFDERLAMDVAYIEAQSFWLDVTIVLRTFCVVVTRKGAS